MVLEVVKPSPSSTPEDVGALAAQVDLEVASCLQLHMHDQVDLQQSAASWRVHRLAVGRHAERWAMTWPEQHPACYPMPANV